MIKLGELLTQWKEYLTLLVAVLVSLILMNSSTHPSAVAFRMGMGSVISVLTMPAMLIPRTVTVFGENAELRAEIIQLKAERDQWRDASLENIRLRKMLGFRERPDYEYLAAEVVGRNVSANLSNLLLNKGVEDSIDHGYAVVTDEGLAGKVFEVHPSHCLVQLAMDRNFAASARVERSRVDGMVRWHGSYKLSMDDVPKNLDVKIGDRIVTSGLGGVIPGGIPIGIVSDVRKVRGEIFQEIIIDPYVSFTRLEEVFVLIPVTDLAEEEK